MLENVKSFTRTNINKPDFTTRKARKSRHFWHFKPKFTDQWCLILFRVSKWNIIFRHTYVLESGNIRWLKECQGMQYPGNEKFLPVDENTWGQVSVQWRLDFSGGRREDIGRDDGDDQEG